MIIPIRFYSLTKQKKVKKWSLSRKQSFLLDHKLFFATMISSSFTTFYRENPPIIYAGGIFIIFSKQNYFHKSEDSIRVSKFLIASLMCTKCQKCFYILPCLSQVATHFHATHPSSFSSVVYYWGVGIYEYENVGIENLNKN